MAVAFPVCTSAALIAGGTCYRTSSINIVQQKALLIYFKLLELAAIDGTDYSDDLDQLLIDSACPLIDPWDPDVIRAANVGIALANATEAGARPPDNIQDQIAAIKCLQHVNGGLAKLEQIDMFMNCLLGTHASQIPIG